MSPGKGYRDDPELYHAAIDGVADRTPEDGWRWSQLTYGETLYETPLALDYSGLNPNRRYRLRVTYAGEDYSLPLRLVLNRGIELQSHVSGNRILRTLSSIFQSQLRTQADYAWNGLVHRGLVVQAAATR